MNIGEKIGYYAKQKKITLRRLAIESGINYNTLYAIVTRNSNRVSVENIKSIAGVLGIPAEDLETDTPLREFEELSDAELKLSATINSIVGLSTGKDKEDKLYLINSFLEAQSELISNCYSAMKR
ncbi:helix-turn-helix domain-containing protein [Butyrivibrio sp. AE2015]|uniref:helix-turn-helix domain-containing protein n=1 Tax=Butyrivibrio sp. AE2015 TaxID=1280663 RepID=UPI0003B4616F|nr:helix-turn-helix transcriptional regulator [Butyrivibrio sp. AE2015]